MKTLLVALVLTIPSVLIAQDSALVFKEAVSVQGASKDELFLRAKDAFGENFLSSKLELKKENKEAGELMGKGVMETQISVLNKPIDSKVLYDVYIKVINGRYLVRLSNFVHQYVNQEFSGFGLLTTSNTNPVKQPEYTRVAMDNLWQQVKQDISIRVEPLMDKLQVVMRKKPADSHAAN